MPSHHVSTQPHPWQLIHDDPFDRLSTDSEIDDVVASFAARSEKPYTELLRRLAGIEEITEAQARAFFRRVVEHRRALAATLGRPVHVRVAALDLLTTRGTKSGTYETHPIVVTPSLLEKAFEEATSDAVTGLPQRAQFMHLLRHELKQRKRRTICVAYIDLDGFKRVNDEHGHAQGDEVLRALAKSARRALREGDMLARVGGDEFALLLLDVSGAEATLAVRRLRARFEALTASQSTSFSAGIVLAAPGEEAEHVVERADQAMYQEKRMRASFASR